MRHRRDVLRGGAGVLLLGLAGCVEERDRPTDGGPRPNGSTDDGGDAGDDGNATDGEDGEQPSDDGTAADEPAGTPSFEVASARVPETAAIGEPVRFRVTVVNTGDAAGTFTSPVSARAEGGEWSQIGEISMDVQARGEGIYRGSVVLDYIGTYEIRVDALDEVWQLRTDPRSLDFGEPYEAPNGLVVTVDDIQFRGSYPYFDDEGGRHLQYAPPNRRYAFLAVRVENTAAYRRRAPPARSFVLVADGDQYDQAELDREIAPVPVGPRTELRGYEGGPTYTGVTRRGVVVYEVSDDVNHTDQITVSWNEAYQGRRVSVNWRPE